MHKSSYKKILVDTRNSFLDYKMRLNDEATDILEKSFVKQKEYLDSITFGLISSENMHLNEIGYIIAYKVFKEKTNKELINISACYSEQYEKVEKEIKRLNKELEKISNTINFIDNINDSEFEKYLSYKIN